MQEKIDTKGFQPPVEADSSERYTFTDEPLEGFPGWNSPPHILEDNSELEPDERENGQGDREHAGHDSDEQQTR